MEEDNTYPKVFTNQGTMYQVKPPIFHTVNSPELTTTLTQRQYRGLSGPHVITVNASMNSQEHHNTVSSQEPHDD